MPELLLELYSEEIPARMQGRAADDLARLVGEALAALTPVDMRSYAGPRRIALSLTLTGETPAATTVERGPRLSAPEQALAGFLRKHAATRGDLAQEGDFWVLHKRVAAQAAATVIATALPGLLRRFPWPKSMRWGATGSQFTWVRPLRRILCILDGTVVPFTLAEGGDDGHGLRAGDETEGHRFMAPGAFAVRSVADWRDQLLARRVVVDAAERRRVIADGVAGLAAAQGCTVVDDAALLDEVAGLVEWPVCLLGRIDPAFMDLPAEVMQVSMRVNQRYFALCTAEGAPAPFFAFAANVEAPDGGAAITAGNERVLRARFSDARHFWDADRRVRLADRVAALDAVTFHAKLGTQGARVHRVMQLAEYTASSIGKFNADIAYKYDLNAARNAARAALLAKADLTTAVVGEFPELQGVIGRYYALDDGENLAVADAVRDHYAPVGPLDDAPTAPVSVAVAIADKVDLITGFFAIDQKPSGSSDQFGLRRAALGLVRIIFESQLRLPMLELIRTSNNSFANKASEDQVLRFVIERMRVFMRSEGFRHDILDAVLETTYVDDLQLIRYLAYNLSAYLATAGQKLNLVRNFKRANNILRIEEAKDGPHTGEVDPSNFISPVESDLFHAVIRVNMGLDSALAGERYNELAPMLSTLGRPLDNFFEVITVNDVDPILRRNRLRLLHRVCAVMNSVADFSRIEG